MFEGSSTSGGPLHFHIFNRNLCVLARRVNEEGECARSQVDNRGGAVSLIDAELVPTVSNEAGACRSGPHDGRRNGREAGFTPGRNGSGLNDRSPWVALAQGEAMRTAQASGDYGHHYDREHAYGVCAEGAKGPSMQQVAGNTGFFWGSKDMRPLFARSQSGICPPVRDDDPGPVRRPTGRPPLWVACIIPWLKETWFV